MIRGDDEYFNENGDDDDDEVDDQELARRGFSSPSQNDVITDATNAIKRRIMAIKSSFEPPPAIYLLGRTLSSKDYEMTSMEESSSLFWFTYRDNFPAIQPYGITTDAGWGCMLRSAQMLLAHTLRVHFQSRHWRPHRGDAFVQTLLTWFADYPSKSSSVYSLHNLCAAGLQYQVLPGEWVGPNTASYVLRDLVELHQKVQPNLFRVHVSSEGTIYEQTVDDVMTRDARRRRMAANISIGEREKSSESQPQQPRPEEVDSPLHPLDCVPSIDPTNTNDWVEEWDTSLLLLIPLRLGLERFNEDYVQSLARTFSLPQSVGVLGGRPRGARWFYGAFANGSKVIGLDPHTIQSTLPRVGGDRNASSSATLMIDLSEEYRSTYFTRYPEVFDLKRMDPSVALGFYCENRNDFEHLKESLSQIHLMTPPTNGRLNDNNATSPNIRSTNPPVLVSFMDKAPDYENNNSASGGGAINDLYGDDMFLGDDGDDSAGGNARIDGDDDDDEDFVLL